MRTQTNKISAKLYFFFSLHKKKEIFTLVVDVFFFFLSFQFCCNGNFQLPNTCDMVYDTNCSDEIIFLTFSLHSLSASSNSKSNCWMAADKTFSSTRNGVLVDTSENLYIKHEMGFLHENTNFYMKIRIFP